MSFKIWWDQTKKQIKTNWSYRHLITRRYVNGEYHDDITFVHKDDLPTDALNVRNYGKYWYYVEDGIQPDPAPSGPYVMRASDVCTWADNNDINKALSQMWNWTNNLDMKKIAIIIGALVVGVMVFMMIR